MHASPGVSVVFLFARFIAPALQGAWFCSILIANGLRSLSPTVNVIIQGFEFHSKMCASEPVFPTTVVGTWVVRFQNSPIFMSLLRAWGSPHQSTLQKLQSSLFSCSGKCEYMWCRRSFGLQRNATSNLDLQWIEASFKKSSWKSFETASLAYHVVSPIDTIQKYTKGSC